MTMEFDNDVVANEVFSYLSSVIVDIVHLAMEWDEEFWYFEAEDSFDFQEDALAVVEVETAFVQTIYEQYGIEALHQDILERILVGLAKKRFVEEV